MKYTTILSTFCFLLFTITLYAQTYTIPGASQQPAWVFPIWFEDGAGQRDTIYIGHDPNAISGGPDTIFGEKWIVYDTNKFCVSADYKSVSGGPDSILKVNIHLFNPDGGSGFIIEFRNATWPLKMKFDVSLFYIDSLPFYQDSLNYPDTLPRGYGEIWCSDFDPNFNNCSNDVP